MTDQLLRDDFRQAMRRLATTVALITTGRGETYGGMAATAVMSVTADPPTLVVAVNRTASMSPILDEHGWFCVNLLAEWHQHLVPIFSGAKSGKNRFEDGDWQFSDAHPPVLADAAASLVCETTGRFDIGTHTLFVGEVRAIANHPRIDPLIWVDGRATSAATT
ncbi:MAG: flavin reductase family protein [Sphingomonadales bacterium]